MIKLHIQLQANANHSHDVVHVYWWIYGWIHPIKG